MAHRLASESVSNPMKQAHATAALAKLENLGVLRDVHGGMAEPFELEFPQAWQQVAGVGAVADDVVIHEEHAILKDEPALERTQASQFRDYFLRRAVAILAAKGCGDRAKLAVQRAAPCRFDKVDRQVTLILIQIPVRPRQML